MLIIHQKRWQSFFLTSYHLECYRKREGKKENREIMKIQKRRRQKESTSYQQNLLIIIATYICLIQEWRWSVTMQAEYRLDISINLSTFFLKNIGVWISRDPSEQRRMRMLLICTVWMLLLGIVINTRDLYFTLLYNGVSMFNCIFVVSFKKWIIV